MELFEQASKLHAEGKLSEAEPIYDRILTQNPNHPHLLASVGTLYLAQNKLGLAIVLLEASIEKLGKRESDILCNLALAYKYSGLHDKAIKLFEEAMKKNPSPQTITSYGSYFVEAGEPEKAVSIFNRALKMEPRFALAHWNLSLALLEDGQWDRAWDEYEWGFDCKMRVDRGPIYKAPRWDGSPGKTVVVYGEQGLGDEIMFASMLPEMMKTNNVILDSHVRLKTLFEKSFGVPVHGTREDEEIDWREEHKIDAQCSSASLGKFYRRSRDKFNGYPYLKAEPLLPKGRKFRVGISWTGGQKTGRVKKRTVPVSWWKSILGNSCEWISLQYTDCEDELMMMETLGYDIRQFPEVKAHDYYETARLVASCDLVISVCTSVVHLAGALGIPCWCMTPQNPAWRYQNTGGMPWYRAVRLYRSQGDWRPVIERVGYDLDQLLNKEMAA